jgi:hypothetical protein
MAEREIYLTSEVAHLIKRPITTIVGVLRAGRMPRPKQARNGWLLWEASDIENLREALKNARPGRRRKDGAA